MTSVAKTDARPRVKTRYGIDRLLAIARGAVGLTSHDDGFVALVAPGEHPARAAQLAQLSTCALFLRGCLARALIDAADDVPLWRALSQSGCPATVPPRLWAPYATGYAMTDLVAVHQASSWRRWRAPAFPLDDGERALLRERVFPGALVIVGAGGREHVYLIDSVERDGWPDGSIELTAIEAGQVDRQGRQCVVRRRHEIDRFGVDRALLREEPADPHGSPGRPVTWVLDPRALLGAPR